MNDIDFLKQGDIEENASEAMEEMPKEVRRTMQAMSIMMRSGPAESPIAKKITEEHITKHLELEEKGLELAYKDKANNRWLVIAVVVCLTVLAGFVLFLFHDDADVVLRIFLPIITGLVGVGGGYGFGKSKREN